MNVTPKCTSKGPGGFKEQAVEFRQTDGAKGTESGAEKKNWRNPQNGGKASKPKGPTATKA